MGLARRPPVPCLCPSTTSTTSELAPKAVVAAAEHHRRGSPSSDREIVAGGWVPIEDLSAGTLPALRRALLR